MPPGCNKRQGDGGKNRQNHLFTKIKKKRLGGKERNAGVRSRSKKIGGFVDGKVISLIREGRGPTKRKRGGITQKWGPRPKGTP